MPSLRKEVLKIHKLNHFASCCQWKNPDKKGVNCVDECNNDEFFIGCITSVNSVDTSEWCENLKKEDKVVKVQLDTGAKVNVIFVRLCFSLPLREDSSQTEILFRPSDSYQRSSDITL